MASGTRISRLALGPADARILCGLTILAWVAMAWPGRPVPGIFPLASLFFPVGAVIFALAMLRSAAATLRRGGVTWRGTLYPLAELRAARVRSRVRMKA